MSNLPPKKGFLVPIFNPLKIHRKVFRRGKFSYKSLIRLTLYSLAALAFVIVVLFAWYSKDLPTPGKVRKYASVESTRIMDRNGALLYDVHGDERRISIPFGEMPDSAKKATVAIEDKDFYQHFGVDFRGVIRAAIYNIFHKKSTQGGSTITQQYVKNALLSPKRTFSRKIKELILSIEIEIMFSKDQILEKYLNEIPYGSNAYGIQAASQTYFGKDAKDLTLAESAILAALPQAPTYYSPYGTHPKERNRRAKYILDRMTDLHFVSKDAANKAKEEIEKVTYVPRREKITAPHFVMYVKELLIDQYGEKMVEEGGLRVTTSLDLEKQKLAEEAIQEGAAKNLKKNGATNAGLVAIDPKNGQILAMVGSTDYFDLAHDGNVNIATSERQPGSAFKPVVYATAFKGKYNPAFTLFDVRTDFGNYTPDNYDGSFRGPVNMRSALGNSLNIPAVKTLYLAGIDESLKTAHEMGITTLNDRNRYGLSLVLGGGEVKLLDLTTAYSVFANNGTLAPTTAILKVEENRGKVLEEFKENKKEVLDPQIAYEISSILSDNEARSSVFGSRSSLYFANRNVAVKTGTTSEFRDAWTVGYTPQLVTGVWVGNFDNTPMGGHAAGAMAAAPIFHQFMENTLKNTKDEPFNRPEEIKEITVDKFTNKLPTTNSIATIKDIFASWQIPTEREDIYKKVKIDVSTGKIATDYCPSDLVEEKTFADLHSEVPQKSNWENPVRAWAEASGFATPPPNETCPLHTSESKPTIAITSPKNNDQLSGTFTINVQIFSPFSVKHVDFFIDNISIGSKSDEPYQINYNANNLSAGDHQIMVMVTDKNSKTAKDSITIKAVKDTTAPNNVTDVSLTPGKNKMSLSWINPSDDDLEYVRIYYSLISGQLGLKYPSDFSADPSHDQSETISGLLPRTTYFFTIRPVDSSGNENANSIQYSGITN